MHIKFSKEIFVGLFVVGAFLIFFYIGFHIGSFRFNKRNYNEYFVFFNQVSGLSKKAEVKISGVKVGWVESTLLDDKTVIVKIKVSRQYPVYENATVVIRQDGWFGPKHLELVQGSELLPQIQSGGSIHEKGKSYQDVDSLLQSMNSIATNIKEVSGSLYQVFGTEQGRSELKEVLQNVHGASKNVQELTTSVNRAIQNNEGQLDAFLGVGTTIKGLAATLEQKVLPSFQGSIEQVATVFDRDFNRIAGRFDGMGGAFENVAKQLSNSIARIDDIADKIDKGQGLVGKLINEDVIYEDIKVAAQGFKNYINRIDRLQLVFDSHFESMRIPAENYHFEDSKGYFDIRLYPQEHFFYQLVIAASEKGFIERKETERSFINGNTLEPVDLNAVDFRVQEYVKDVFREQKLTFRRNKIRFGFQFGTVFRRLSVRFGIFDGSAGIGFDINVGFARSKFHWITTFEAFDFSGFNRKDDRRPHFKWLNKIFFTSSLYFTFGADDFISKRNANIFFGGGIRFGDDDIKYLLGSISGAASVAS